MVNVNKHEESVKQLVTDAHAFTVDVSTRGELLRVVLVVRTQTETTLLIINKEPLRSGCTWQG